MITPAKSTRQRRLITPAAASRPDPVIAPLAISPEGDALNVDADRAAAMVAGAVKAEKLILLTNVPGLMRSFPDESTLIAPH